MREIKFRAWDSFHKVMREHKSIPVLMKNIKDDNVWKFMQFIGIRDINGEEIYEGDILKYIIDDQTSKETYIDFVRYEGSMFCFGEFCPVDSFQDCNLVVIGNIYQNPELLNQ